MASVRAQIESVEASAYIVPTDGPEADGTLSWDSTTLILAEVTGGGMRGLGYTYADASVVPLICKKLRHAIMGRDVLDVPAIYWVMQQEVRNLGAGGLAMMAISAVDTAVWDLKAKLLNLPVVSLLGAMRHEIPIYGSGGFTSYPEARMRDQLAGWVARDGCRSVKMKIGSHPDLDLERVRAARSAIGEAGLFVDANGAYTRKQALSFAEKFEALHVTWFESRSRAMTSTGCASYGTARRRAWRSPPESMAPRPPTSNAC